MSKAIRLAHLHSQQIDQLPPALVGPVQRLPQAVGRAWLFQLTVLRENRPAPTDTQRLQLYHGRHLGEARGLLYAVYLQQQIDRVDYEALEAYTEAQAVLG